MPVFFFHARGVETEKSFEGLLRSIIHQLILDVPELVDCVAEIYQEYDEQDQMCPWNLRHLETALENLRRKDLEGSICLFIDALDEYAGRREDIARFIKRLALPMGNAEQGKLRIRVCASSRPETTFISLLKGIPSLTIQDWTTEDIKRYADDRLKDCDRTDTNVILDKITNRADGVFLWTKLVLDEVWQPLCDGKSIEEGLSLVSKLPTTLPDFYKRMVEQIHREDRSIFMAMLELTLSSDYLGNLATLDAFCLMVDILGREDTVTPKDIDLLPAEDERRLHEVGKRIRACSGGLLEISSSRRVQFVHQTVKSFIQDNENSALFDGKSTTDLTLAGLERRMFLITILVGKMDSTPSWQGIYHFQDTSDFERIDNFDPGVLVAFAAFEMVAECSFKSINTDLVYDFEAAMHTYCGEDWLDTWWSSVVTPRSVFGGLWVKGSLQPKLFMEFAMQLELIGFVKIELEKEISAKPDGPRNSRLWHYTLAGNATSRWHNDRFLYQSPESWLDFAKFLLTNGFDPNAMLEVDVGPDRGIIMAIRNDNTPLSQSLVDEQSSLNYASDEDVSEVSDTADISTKSAERSKSHKTQSKENTKQNTTGSDTKYQDAKEPEDDSRLTRVGSNITPKSDICRVSVIHLALAMACANDYFRHAEYILYRLNMLCLLVEESNEVTVSSYRNYWSLTEEGAVEQSAIHYLLIIDSYSEDVIDARNKCIIAFLNKGADPNAVDRTGASILETCLESCPNSLIEFILDKGAKVTPGLLSDSGAPRLDAGGILNEMRWRKPEIYTPEARRIAMKYNSHWPALEEEEDLEPVHVSSHNTQDLLGSVSGYIGNLTESVRSWASSSRRH